MAGGEGSKVAFTNGATARLEFHTHGFVLKISIVTPSYNQGHYLEQTIRSVLQQEHSPLEYFVVDNGSTDQSHDVLRKFEGQLQWWVNDRNQQYDAINKGFARSSGEVMGWLNSDDMYPHWTLSVVAEIFEAFSEIEWLTTLHHIIWDTRGRAVRGLAARGYTRAGFLAGENLPRMPHYSTSWIQQESTFWRRSLWERAGGRLSTEHGSAGDFELWARFFQHAELYAADTPLGGFRFHGLNQSNVGKDAYLEHSERALREQGGKRPSALYAALRRFVFSGCPRPLQPLAHKFGLLRAAKVVRHHRYRDGWKLITVMA